MVSQYRSASRWFSKKVRGTRRAPRFEFVTSLEALEARLLLSTIVVTNNADSGPGTLRDAITQADLDTTPDTIDFNIGGGGHQVIALASALPVLTNAITIDGSSQPGFAGSPLIEINGAGLVMHAIELDAPSCSIRSLVINNVTGAYDSGVAIFINGSATNFVIQGNEIGTDFTGETAIPVSQGIECYAATGIIGGTSPGQGNLISGATAASPDGNNGYGLRLQSNLQVLVEGNQIGTDAAGMKAIPNSIGIAIASNPGADTEIIGGTAPGAGNLISGNNWGALGQFGNAGIFEGDLIGTDRTGQGVIPNQTGLSHVDVVGGTVAGARNIISGNLSDNIYNANVVQGNYIGTDITGTLALANGRDGVNGGGLIGGPTAAARNIIAGNPGGDIVNAIGTTIQNNFIGTDVTGEFTLDGFGGGEAGIVYSNGATILNNLISTRNEFGIRQPVNSIIQGNRIGTNKEGTAAIGNDTGIWRPSGGNTIGGSAPGQANLISGNGAGMLITDTNVANPDSIVGNLIGTDVTGNLPLANGTGIYVDGVTQYLIGNTTPGLGNVIAFNTYNGILVNSQAVGVSILGNAIHDNGAEILVPPPGYPTPVLTSASAGAATNITGTLAGSPGAVFRVEFFASHANDSAGHSQGERYLGYTNVTIAGSGIGSINAMSLGASSAVEVISATATVINGSTYGSTSAFSSSVAAANLAVQPVFTSLASPTVTYATPSVILSGKISAGTQVPSGNVSITVGNVTQTAVIQADGSFSTTVNTSAFGVSTSPYAITYSYAGTGNFLSAVDGTKTLTVNPAATNLVASTSASTSVPGQYVVFTATVGVASGVSLPTGSITFSAGSTTLGSATLQGNTATITVALPALGTQTITATFVPNSPNYSPQTGSLTQTVQSVSLEPGTVAGQSILYVGGSVYNEAIGICVTPKTSSVDQYAVVIDTLNGRCLSETITQGAAAGHITKVVAIGNGTNDVIVVDSGPSVASWLFGGPGNNILSGGDGNNVLVGGGGANILFGGVGRSLLIAGTGASGLFAGSGDTILIGGTTAFDTPTPAHLASLDHIMAEWGSKDSYATRVADISNTGTGTSFAARLNGNDFLATGGPTPTVFDNGHSDLLVGGSGMDWFLADLTVAANDRDSVINQRKKEILTPIG